MAGAESPNFACGERFEIREQLGAGGMGVVYRAFDAERGIDVALKTLRTDDPELLYRFKREFRALADISHPNLISLYELVAEDDHWFFTMELLGAVDFLSHVRSPPDVSDAPEPDEGRLSETVPTVQVSLRKPSAAAAVDFALLRDALRQLARGITALHDAGYLHCDIKPSNVLVTSDRRVVLLDFGVIADAARAAAAASTGTFSGTPAYVAPEQARGEAASPASDWYSVGVVLYQALCGQLPYEGTQEQILDAKQSYDPPPPSALSRDIPPDLDALCVALLRRSPDERATRTDVHRLLGERRTSGTSPPSLPPTATSLIGRDAHLIRLREVFALTRERIGPTVYLHGSSGSGKSVLARRFLDEVRAEGDAVVLEGRCYERESVPYQAVDTIVDSLSQYLNDLPPEEADALMPRNVSALVQVFPVLERVDAVARARRRYLGAPDPQELRRIAFGALRELFGRLAAMRPLVLCVDDLQWGDPDSALLLGSITQPPDAPPMLLLATYRDEDAEQSELLRALFRREARWGTGAHVVRIEVGRLAHDDTVALATQMLAEVGLGPRNAGVIASESGGNPFFVHELVHYAKRGSNAGVDREALTIDAMIRERVSEFSPMGRRLLETVALAGRPIAQRTVRQAADIPAVDGLRIVRELSTAQLVRISGPRDTDVIACYHDRIRQAVADGLSADAARAVHARLAAALETSEDADAQTLLEHYHAAGNAESAARFAVRAAEEAADALAFDRAARLYRQAIELAPQKGEALRRQQIALATALVNSGRCAEGAEVFVAAAGDRADLDAIELRRRAAEQFLCSGHTDRGLETLASVLRELGLRMPRTPLRAVPVWLLRKVQLRLRGLRYRVRAADEMSPRDQLRLDTCLAVATGLALLDPARAGVFGVRNLLLSLDAGDPVRVAVALGIEGAYVAARGRRSERRAQYLLSRAEAMAEQIDEPYVTAFTMTMRAFEAHQRGRFPESHEVSLRADEMLREQCTGVTWARKLLELHFLGSLMFTGQHGELVRLVPGRVAEAEETGDQFAIGNLRSLFIPITCIAKDAPDDGLLALAAAERQRSPAAHVQRGFALFTGSMTDMYAGDGRSAYERFRIGTKPLVRSLVAEAEMMRGLLWHFRASAALMAAAQGAPHRKRLMREAARDARRLRRTGTPWFMALGVKVAAGVAAARGDEERTAQLLAEAVSRCDASSLGAWASAARWRLGRLLGGDKGALMVEQGLRWLAEHGNARPERLAAAIVPGFTDD